MNYHELLMNYHKLRVNFDTVDIWFPRFAGDSNKKSTRYFAVQRKR